METDPPTILVLDDLREWHHDDYTADHVKSNEEFDRWLSTAQGEVIAMLDHDAGGEAYGPETFRSSVRALVAAHQSGQIDLFVAYIVTMNMPGQQWIASELRNAGIPFVLDPGGRGLGMKAPKGF